MNEYLITTQLNLLVDEKCSPCKMLENIIQGSLYKLLLVITYCIMENKIQFEHESTIIFYEVRILMRLDLKYSLNV